MSHHNKKHDETSTLSFRRSSTKKHNNQQHSQHDQQSSNSNPSLNADQNPTIPIHNDQPTQNNSTTNNTEKNNGTTNDTINTPTNNATRSTCISPALQKQLSPIPLSLSSRNDHLEVLNQTPTSYRKRTYTLIIIILAIIIMVFASNNKVQQAVTEALQSTVEMVQKQHLSDRLRDLHLTANYPVVIIPGIVTSQLEVYSSDYPSSQGHLSGQKSTIDEHLYQHDDKTMNELESFIQFIQENKDKVAMNDNSDSSNNNNHNKNDIHINNDLFSEHGFEQFLNEFDMIFKQPKVNNNIDQDHDDNTHHDSTFPTPHPIETHHNNNDDDDITIHEVDMTSTPNESISNNNNNNSFFSSFQSSSSKSKPKSTQLKSKTTCVSPTHKTTLWGGSSMVNYIVRDPICFIKHLRLNSTTGMDNNMIALRSIDGAKGGDYLITGYWVWARVLNFFDKIMSPNMYYMATYDWRLTMKGLELRDGYFTRLKQEIERLVMLHQKPVVIVNHSMGSIVTQYALQFISWSEGMKQQQYCQQNQNQQDCNNINDYTNLSSKWFQTHIKSVVNIAGPQLGVPKAIAAVLSGEMKDIAALGDIGNFFRKTAMVSDRAMIQLLRSFHSVASMLPRGGETIWGGNFTYNGKQSGLSSLLIQEQEIYDEIFHQQNNINNGKNNNTNNDDSTYGYNAPDDLFGFTADEFDYNLLSDELIQQYDLFVNNNITSYGILQRNITKHDYDDDQYGFHQDMTVEELSDDYITITTQEQIDPTSKSTLPSSKTTINTQTTIEVEHNTHHNKLKLFVDGVFSKFDSWLNNKTITLMRFTTEDTIITPNDNIEPHGSNINNNDSNDEQEDNENFIDSPNRCRFHPIMSSTSTFQDEQSILYSPVDDDNHHEDEDEAVISRYNSHLEAGCIGYKHKSQNKDQYDKQLSNSIFSTFMANIDSTTSSLDLIDPFQSFKSMLNQRWEETRTFFHQFSNGDNNNNYQNDILLQQQPVIRHSKAKVTVVKAFSTLLEGLIRTVHQVQQLNTQSTSISPLQLLNKTPSLQLDVENNSNIPTNSNISNQTPNLNNNEDGTTLIRTKRPPQQTSKFLQYLQDFLHTIQLQAPISIPTQYQSRSDMITIVKKNLFDTSFINKDFLFELELHQNNTNGQQDINDISEQLNQQQLEQNQNNGTTTINEIEINDAIINEYLPQPTTIPSPTCHTDYSLSITICNKYKIDFISTFQTSFMTLLLDDIQHNSDQIEISDFFQILSSWTHILTLPSHTDISPQQWMNELKYKKSTTTDSSSTKSASSASSSSSTTTLHPIENYDFGLIRILAKEFFYSVYKYVYLQRQTHHVFSTSFDLQELILQSRHYFNTQSISSISGIQQGGLPSQHDFVLKNTTNPIAEDTHVKTLEAFTVTTEKYPTESLQPNNNNNNQPQKSSSNNQNPYLQLLEQQSKIDQSVAYSQNTFDMMFNNTNESKSTSTSTQSQTTSSNSNNNTTNTTSSNNNSQYSNRPLSRRSINLHSAIPDILPVIDYISQLFPIVMKHINKIRSYTADTTCVMNDNHKYTSSINIFEYYSQQSQSTTKIKQSQSQHHPQEDDNGDIRGCFWDVLSREAPMYSEKMSYEYSFDTKPSHNYQYRSIYTESYQIAQKLMKLQLLQHKLNPNQTNNNDINAEIMSGNNNQYIIQPTGSGAVLTFNYQHRISYMINYWIDLPLLIPQPEFNDMVDNSLPIHNQQQKQQIPNQRKQFDMIPLLSQPQQNQSQMKIPSRFSPIHQQLLTNKNPLLIQFHSLPFDLHNWYHIILQIEHLYNRIHLHQQQQFKVQSKQSQQRSESLDSPTSQSSVLQSNPIDLNHFQYKPIEDINLSPQYTTTEFSSQIHNYHCLLSNTLQSTAKYPLNETNTSPFCTNLGMNAIKFSEKHHVLKLLPIRYVSAWGLLYRHNGGISRQYTRSTILDRVLNQDNIKKIDAIQKEVDNNNNNMNSHINNNDISNLSSLSNNTVYNNTDSIIQQLTTQHMDIQLHGNHLLFELYLESRQIFEQLLSNQHRHKGSKSILSPPKNLLSKLQLLSAFKQQLYASSTYSINIQSKYRIQPTVFIHPYIPSQSTSKLSTSILSTSSSHLPLLLPHSSNNLPSIQFHDIDDRDWSNILTIGLPYNTTFDYYSFYGVNKVTERNYLYIGSSGHQSTEISNNDYIINSIIGGSLSPSMHMYLDAISHDISPLLLSSTTATTQSSQSQSSQLTTNQNDVHTQNTNINSNDQNEIIIDKTVGLSLYNHLHTVQNGVGLVNGDGTVPLISMSWISSTNGLLSLQQNQQQKEQQIPPRKLITRQYDANMLYQPYLTHDNSIPIIPYQQFDSIPTSSTNNNLSTTNDINDNSHDPNQSLLSSLHYQQHYHNDSINTQLMSNFLTSIPSKLLNSSISLTGTLASSLTPYTLPNDFDKLLMFRLLSNDHVDIMGNDNMLIDIMHIIGHYNIPITSSKLFSSSLLQSTLIMNNDTDNTTTTTTTSLISPQPAQQLLSNGMNPNEFELMKNIPGSYINYMSQVELYINITQHQFFIQDRLYIEKKQLDIIINTINNINTQFKIADIDYNNNKTFYQQQQQEQLQEQQQTASHQQHVTKSNQISFQLLEQLELKKNDLQSKMILLQTQQQQIQFKISTFEKLLHIYQTKLQSFESSWIESPFGYYPLCEILHDDDTTTTNSAVPEQPPLSDCITLDGHIKLSNRILSPLQQLSQVVSNRFFNNLQR